MVYLDAASTAEYQNKDDIVIDAITTAMKTLWHNPSSLYASNIKEKINESRANIAEFIKAKPNEIYFTSGASEANNWALRGWLDNTTNSISHTNIITTPIEHKSILSVVQSDALDICTHYCDVDEFGLVNIESLEHLLYEHECESILVSINMANNEIGTIQNIRKISELVHEYGGILHVDATQAFAHIPINVKELDIDMMSCSGHKISPVLRGVGFLYKKNCINIQPLIYGTQEKGIRGGTENTFGIVGLDKALESCNVSDNKIIELCKKRDYFINLLSSEFGCKLNGHSEFRLPNNINVTFPQNITNEGLLYMLDLSNIQIGIGSACNSRSIEPSHVLKAIGLTNEDAMKTIRITLSEEITYENIDYVINEIKKIIKIIEM